MLGNIKHIQEFGKVFNFLRFLSPGLQWKYNISSTPVFPCFEDHKATERAHLLCCFLAAGIHTTGVWPQILSSTSYMLLESPGITETLPYRITHRVSSPQRVRESAAVIVQLALHGGFLKCLQVANSPIVPENWANGA